MPNIIEQQDILKGLPDARLAMLLQNPVGDIPPFLVAAEAQRREAIRQQFAGQPPKESVVESLTKQLARVPQNIQAPAQMPPMVPPTPQMAGVAALEQQQMMEQAAMNAQPQQMRHGGMVRRFNGAFGSFVAPTVSRNAQTAPTVEEMAGYVDPFGIPPMSDEGSGWSFPSLRDLGVPSPFPTYITQEEADRMFAEEKERKAAEKAKRLEMTPAELGEYYTMNRLDKERELRRTNKQAAPTPDPKEPTAPEPEPGETEDEFRARMDELLQASEPSDWEKSQRWFAMAEQFLDPSKTTMQSVAGAGRAFADQSAAMAAAQRQAEREYMKGMLEYDMAVSERERAERASTAETQRNAYKFYAEQARAQIDSAAEQLKAIARQKSEFTKDGMMTDPSSDPAYIELNRQEKELIAIIDKYRGQYASALRGLGALTGTNPSVEVFTGDEIARFGG